MADLKELGHFLRSQREAKNISLEEVSMATKVNIKVLQAIEDGDEDRLPPKPFVRGFIQSYARYLGLDPKEILDQFQQITGTVPQRPIAIQETEKKIERGLPGNARSIITVTLIIIAIIGIVFIQRFIAKREAEMKGEVQAITGSDQPLKIQSGSPSPGGMVSAMSSPMSGPTGSPTSVMGFGATSSPTSTPQATVTATPEAKSEKMTATPAPTATPKPTATPTPAPTPTATKAPTPEPSPTETPAEAVPQEIIVEALDKVTITITIDNKASEEVSMNPDQIQTFKAKGKIKLVTPDGGAISVIHNGYDLGVPGNLGQPKTMVFPK